MVMTTEERKRQLEQELHNAILRVGFIQGQLDMLREQTQPKPEPSPEQSIPNEE